MRYNIVIPEINKLKKYTKRNIWRVSPNSKKSGVYLLLKDNVVMYVGESGNIMQRLYSHKNKDYWDKFAYVESNRKERVIAETLYIDKFKPRYNKRC